MKVRLVALSGQIWQGAAEERMTTYAPERIQQPLSLDNILQVSTQNVYKNVSRHIFLNISPGRRRVFSRHWHIIFLTLFCVFSSYAPTIPALPTFVTLRNGDFWCGQNASNNAVHFFCVHCVHLPCIWERRFLLQSEVMHLKEKVWITSREGEFKSKSQLLSGSQHQLRRIGLH